MWKLARKRGNIAEFYSFAFLPGRLGPRSEVAPVMTLTPFRLSRFFLSLLIVAVSLTLVASAEWKEKVLYSFQGGTSDGASPTGGVVFDIAGNLYGATTQGGGECPPAQCGTVFQLAPPAKKGDPWSETVLHVFKGNAFGDGNTPAGGLIIDGSGNLYGTTGYGGTGSCTLLGEKMGCGTVYELSPPAQKGGAWTETVLYSFPTAKQGYLPNGDLVFDSAGNLYGATMFGGGHGTTCNSFYQYCGAIFELSPPKTKSGKWTEKVLHGFKSGSDGASPNGDLVLDTKGSIYGTTYEGGFHCPHDSGQGCGTVFKLNPPTEKGGSWTENVIHRYNRGNSDGAYPQSGVILDATGRVCGATLSGGLGTDGTTFCLTAPSGKSGSWTQTILYAFNGRNKYGGNPVGGLTLHSGNVLYGTTNAGGGYFAGAVFQLEPKGEGANWDISLLYTFKGPPDAAFPLSRLIFDRSGRAYGTTQAGGSGQACQSSCGAIFQVSP